MRIFPTSFFPPSLACKPFSFYTPKQKAITAFVIGILTASVAFYLFRRYSAPSAPSSAFDTKSTQTSRPSTVVIHDFNANPVSFETLCKFAPSARSTPVHSRPSSGVYEDPSKLSKTVPAFMPDPSRPLSLINPHSSDAISSTVQPAPSGPSTPIQPITFRQPSAYFKTLSTGSNVNSNSVEVSQLPSSKIPTGANVQFEHENVDGQGRLSVEEKATGKLLLKFTGTFERADSNVFKEGVLEYSDGTTYNGQFANGLREGIGCIDFPDKSYILGTFKEDKLMTVMAQGSQTDFGLI